MCAVNSLKYVSDRRTNIKEKPNKTLNPHQVTMGIIKLVDSLIYPHIDASALPTGQR